MTKRKTLLIDIDYTIMYEGIPRPYLKEFILRMNEKYDIGFYTAAIPMRITEVLRIFNFKFGLDHELIRKIQRRSLHRDNCRMIEFWTSNCSSMEIKCFKKAAEILKIDKEDIILLDDNPKYGHPDADKIIQAEGFRGDQDDTYLLTLDI